MNGIQNSVYEERAVSYLPVHIANHIRRSADFSDGISEIRLTVGADVCILSKDSLKSLPVVCSCDDMRYALRSLCGNSVYSHSESIKEGYVTTTDGIRAGVAGRAVVENGTVSAVSDITSIVIRLPHRFHGAAEELRNLLEGFSYGRSVLVYSPPGGGKTTLLRELAASLGQGSEIKRVAVVDSRCELGFGVEGLNVNVLLGYPRHKGIEIALRTLGAEIIICDEISTEEDASAALECLGAGVTLVGSAHGTMDDIFSRPIVKKLHTQKLFGAYYGIEKSPSGFFGKITMAKDVPF